MKKLPIHVGTEIFIRPVKNQSVQARSSILGAKHGDFLIIGDPVVRYSDRLFAKLSGEVNCRYLYDGELYDFDSRVRKSLQYELTLLEYPSDFAVHALRKHPRIRVNIETMVTPETDRQNPMRAYITDISEGGCCVVASVLYAFEKDSVCFLDFTLPDKAEVVGCKAKILKVKFSKLEGSTEIGLQFTGSPDQMSTISSFCHFCSFFEV